MSLNPTFRAKAVAWAGTIPAVELRGIVEGRLLGTHARPLFDRDEWPEDVVIELLADDCQGLSHAMRHAVAEGCVAAAAKVAGAYVGQQGFDDEFSAAALRILRVAEASGLAELKRFVASFSFGVADGSLTDEVLVSAAVRASTRMLSQPGHLGYWLVLAENPRVCAIAFRRAMSLAPYNPQLSRLIDKYWQAQLREGWAVDTPLLLRDLAKLRNQSDLIRNSLGRVPTDLKEDVRELLRKRPWSQAWLAYVRSAVRPVIDLRPVRKDAYDNHVINLDNAGEEARRFLPEKDAPYSREHQFTSARMN